MVDGATSDGPAGQRRVHHTSHRAICKGALVTLSLACVRNVGTVRALVFASDSRLRSGEAWDSCPKIFTLPRSDCLISFAGQTHYAYPLMLQMIQSSEVFRPSRSRRFYL